ncbi:hypothetical protein [Methanosarcina sp.]|uniref:hypothetical protein n=1 Tax=Methanosarcina sp. TaxID=2213 RepID=UPI003BB68229
MNRAVNELHRRIGPQRTNQKAIKEIRDILTELPPLPLISFDAPPPSAPTPKRPRVELPAKSTSKKRLFRSQSSPSHDGPLLPPSPILAVPLPPSYPPPGKFQANAATSHSGKSKDTWRLTVHPSTKVLIVGSSNSRMFRDMPDTWQAEAFGGLKLQHLPSLLTSTPLDPDLTLVISCGMNHRSDSMNFVDQQLETVNKTLQQLKLKKVFWVLPSLPVLLSDEDRKGLIYFNQVVSTFIRSVTTIKPLLLEQDSIVKGDPYGIHYVQNVVDRILEDIKKNVSC